METSILKTIRGLVGVGDDYDAFDREIIPAINTALFTLWQLGVGNDSSAPFSISDETSTWDEFVEDGMIEMCKNYIGVRVRLLFDPPASGVLLENIKEQAREYEFRMTVGMDEYNK